LKNTQSSSGIFSHIVVITTAWTVPEAHEKI